MAASLVHSSLLAKPVAHQRFVLAAHFSRPRLPKRLFHSQTCPASISEQGFEASRVDGHANSSGHPIFGLGNSQREPTLAREKTKGWIGLSGFRQSNGPTASFNRFFFDRSPEQPVRVRFAPSPTGYLHLGSLRTALFNALAARASEGAFILRIEDTDQNRLVSDAEARLMQDLKWTGLQWDEGPDRGGPFGPYRQSERLHIYQEHAQRLIDDGVAYRCFCSHDQLEGEKLRLKEAGMPVVYSGVCRSIDPSDSHRYAASGKHYAIRFRGDLVGASRFRDAVYGFFENHQPEDDYIILKGDGFPTYHLANVIDDHLMRITHVIRGDEWLISTPKHLALYKAFDWEPPTFAHLGLLVGPGKIKLSKRNHDFQVAEYQKRKIFPMALLCWLANFGSSLRNDLPGINKVPRTVTELSKQLTFKFTRGCIQVNYELLDRWQVKYRNALLTEHIPRLANAEFQLIHHNLIKPALRDIESVSSPGNDFKQGLPAEWKTDLQPVPALQVDKTKTEYVARVFWNAGHQMMPFPAIRLFVQKHPYLFWRVPAAIYESSVRTSPPNRTLLDLMDQAISQEHLWDKNENQVVKAIRMAALDNCETSPTERKTVSDELELDIHNTVRLIAIGAARGVSLTTNMLLAVLGRDEWRHRLHSLNTALKKVQQSGPTPS